MQLPPTPSVATLGVNRQRLLRLYYVLWMCLGLALFLIAAFGYRAYQDGHNEGGLMLHAAASIPGVDMLDTPETLPSFKLTDHHGLPFTQDRLNGKWTIMSFGYTHCPDFCPTTLATLNNIYHRLEHESPVYSTQTQVVFVSVDPFRDTADALADFVGHFNPKFIGATGSPAELRRLAEPLGMSYDYADPVSGNPLSSTAERPAHDYTVDHGAALYLFDDHGRLVAWIVPPHTQERIFSIYQQIRRKYHD